MNIVKKIINIPSTFATGKELALKGFENDEEKYRKKQKNKILFHTFLNPFFAYEWFEYIKTPEFYHIFLQRPRIYIKPFRPYISIKWSKKKKIEVIRSNYQFLRSKGLEERVLSNNFTIAEVRFEGQHYGELAIEYDERFRKEGEMVLVFKSEQCGGKVASVSFSFAQGDSQEWVCYVGCVQGHTDKKDFKQAQKFLFGMRPNSFIIFALQEFIRNLSCSSILAVNNSIQANRKKHFINIQSIHKISFDYDKFYPEVGGKPISTDWSELPLTHSKKDIMDIKSKKRSQYKKRYALLDDIEEQIKLRIKS